jgi:DNA primase
VPKEQQGFIGDRSSLHINASQNYELLKQVAQFYHQQFRENPDAQKAISYLKGRGIAGDLARQFLLGYAPNQWKTLEAKFGRKSLLEVGLLKAGESGDLYERFRGRIMFPIRDRRGRVIGFGGRVLDDSRPKYLNSPETPYFQKGKEVYGLYEVLKKQAKPACFVIVEGYMDVIALHQYGIANTVAVLGTALSETHLNLLFRFSSKLVFCFDGDTAGGQAAWRAVEAVLPVMRDGRQVKIMVLPQGEDPDSLIRGKGVDVFAELQEHAQPLSNYFFSHLTDSYDLNTLEGRASLIREAKTYLEKLPNGVYQELMLGQLKKLAEVENLDFFDSSPAQNLGKPSLLVAGQKKNSPARTVIALLLQNPGLIKFIDGQMIDCNGLESPGINLLRKIVKRIATTQTPSLVSLVESFRGEAEEKYVRQLGFQDIQLPEDVVNKEFTEALSRMIGQEREKALEKLILKEKAQGLDETERHLFLKLLENK